MDKNHVLERYLSVSMTVIILGVVTCLLVLSLSRGLPNLPCQKLHVVFVSKRKGGKK